jgi:hypothetical protein
MENNAKYSSGWMMFKIVPFQLVAASKRESRDVFARFDSNFVRSR